MGGLPEERGVVSTASYEARPFGVHSAMPSAQAMRLCPHAIWTHGHFDRYREMSAKVMAILADETPYVDQVSIDEAFFDITPGRFRVKPHRHRAAHPEARERARYHLLDRLGAEQDGREDRERSHEAAWAHGGAARYGSEPFWNRCPCAR